MKHRIASVRLLLLLAATTASAALAQTDPTPATPQVVVGPVTPAAGDAVAEPVPDAAGTIAATSATTTAAPTDDTSPTDDAFRVQFNLGVWLTMATTHATGPAGAGGGLDADISDMLENTDLALFGGVEMTKRHWLLSINGVYAALSVDTQAPNGLDVQVSNDLAVVNAMLGYTLFDNRTVGGVPIRLTPGIGVQYTSVDMTLDGGSAGRFDDSAELWDPVIGGRLVFSFKDNLDWRTDAFIGGFGAGSEITWFAGTYLDWAFSRHVAANLGYRALSWEFETDAGVNWDLLLQGPWIGITIY